MTSPHKPMPGFRYSIRAHRKLVLACAFIGGLLGWMIYASLPRTYVATCYIYEPGDILAVCSLGPLPSGPNGPRFPFVRRIARTFDQIANTLGHTNTDIEWRLDKYLDENPP